MRQLGQLSTCWRITERKRVLDSVRAIDVDTIQEENVEVGVCIERTCKALNQRNRTSVTHLAGKSKFSRTS